MASAKHARSKSPVSAQSEVAAAEVLAWVSDCLDGGLCFIAKGLLIFENAQFGELVEAPRPPSDPESPTLRSQLFADAIVWNQETLGTRRSKTYRLADRQGQPLVYECRFNVVPYHGETGVLLILQNVTEHMELVHEASQIARFQSVLARIGTLAVSDAPAHVLMNEAVKHTAEALEVELCKILVPRESDDHLAVVAGIGLEPELIGRLTIEGGTHSQAGYAIRERLPVVVRDLRKETRFTPSKLLTEHGGIAGMCVPMLVEDRVYGAMTAHSKSVRDFTVKELEFLCTVANTVATVLERRRRADTQRDLYHRLFMSAQDGIMLTDTEGRILEWNPALERMTGWSRDEALGQRPSILRSGKLSPEFYERLWQAIRSGLAFVDRFVNRRKDGSEFLVWESVSPVKDRDETTQFYLAILTDLSEREQMLEALRHAEQVKLVGQLAGGILHEVRNPLIGLGSLATHLAEQEQLPRAARDRCALIAREAARIDELLESHLSQLRPRPFDLQPCNLLSLIDDMLTLLKPNLQKQRITIRKLIPEVGSIEASRTHLQQVFLNISMNAIDAMPNGGELTITAARVDKQGPGVSVTFSDTGKGIEPEDLQRIFEPFFTSGKAKGVGLGLTITHDIVERHGGQLTITSPPGSGAMVEVWLPMKRDT
ncbi:MAG: PAS domain S-box protein [Nitrospira sp.]|jgi:PAS domain S-box-containing protein|nr:PAS domain S-box protein [Nitrospira sp.]MDH4357829.1 PAS domain S-box protein [Nitrospira sp.]MDH5320325.1 PAS domain S-box protein [Nitrospira sp.]